VSEQNFRSTLDLWDGLLGQFKTHIGF